jgi:hypothetical protein
MTEWRKSRKANKDKNQLTEVLAVMSPTIRDDVGVTEVFAASHHP